VPISSLPVSPLRVARQVNALVDSFPSYESNLRDRIAELQAGEAGLVTKVRNAMRRITRQIEETKPRAATPGAAREAKAATPTPVTGRRRARAGSRTRGRPTARSWSRLAASRSSWWCSC
jgi:hypothetical protein